MSEGAERPLIKVADLCQTHSYLLVHQTGFGPDDAWRALIVVAQIALFQAATCDAKVQAETGGDVTKFEGLGCLACRKPDAFGSLVDAAQRAGKDGALTAMKDLGERWLANVAGTGKTGPAEPGIPV